MNFFLLSHANPSLTMPSFSLILDKLIERANRIPNQTCDVAAAVVNPYSSEAVIFSANQLSIAE